MAEQTDTSKRPETNEEWNAKFLRGGIDTIAGKLRELADRIDRTTYGIEHIGQPGRANYGQVVVDVHHELAWGFANLNADNLIRYATDADIARAKGE